MNHSAKLSLTIIIIIGIIAPSCCSMADCGSVARSFSLGFLNADTEDRYYFDIDNDVELKFFYGDSIFSNVLKQESGAGDSVNIRFFVDLPYPTEDYFVLANDTLLGTLNVKWKYVEQECCSGEQKVDEFTFISNQEFSTDFGLWILL
ncbi:MAG: hypothetical protein ACI83W_001517 [Marinoscillum sp.]|jgi:hypothetical protein